MKAHLILEDGHVFSGTAFGCPRETICEIVFNTSMCGYTEIITDPSYFGQAVVMTYPLMGNYGICKEDFESDGPQISALIVGELSGLASNFRNELSLEAVLSQAEVPGIKGIDTRALVRLLRDFGTMRGLLTLSEPVESVKPELLEKIKSWVPAVRPTERGGKTFGAAGKKIALPDTGVKRSLIEKLCGKGCAVKTFSPDASFEEIAAWEPDGVMLGNGPGDPREPASLIALAKRLFDEGMPMLGIGLGHQIMALAAGAETEKMRYGHRGGNQPVRDTATGRVYITSQNHGYAVSAASVTGSFAEISFENVNDRTVEGLRFTGKRALSVQFDPGSGNGAFDTGYVLDEFISLL